MVAVELPLIPKVIDCMHQTIKTYIEREHSILLSVTHTLYVYQVCHDVGRCVKDGSCLNLEWKSMTVLMGYLTISANVRRYQTHHRWHFFLREDRALTHMHCACNTVQLLRRSRLRFSWTMSPTAPSWTHWLQDLGSHTAAWVWVVNQKDWRNQGTTSWILAMHWYST